MKDIKGMFAELEGLSQEELNEVQAENIKDGIRHGVDHAVCLMYRGKFDEVFKDMGEAEDFLIECLNTSKEKYCEMDSDELMFSMLADVLEAKFGK